MCVCVSKGYPLNSELDKKKILQRAFFFLSWTVIDLLDQQKRESLGARDAIRWLEIKFRHGSRFIRSQRPHERTHLPLIKYPKRKDKEAW